ARSPDRRLPGGGLAAAGRARGRQVAEARTARGRPPPSADHPDRGGPMGPPLGSNGAARTARRASDRPSTAGRRSARAPARAPAGIAHRHTAPTEAAPAASATRPREAEALAHSIEVYAKAVLADDI